MKTFLILDLRLQAETSTSSVEAPPPRDTEGRTARRVSNWKIKAAFHPISRLQGIDFSPVRRFPMKKYFSGRSPAAIARKKRNYF
jgi:hypothetical protein